MDLVPEGFKDVLENSRDHDSTKVAEILQVFSEAKEAILLPEHCLRSPDRVFRRHSSMSRVFPLALPLVHPRASIQGRETKPPDLPAPIKASASPFVLAITRNASANDRLQPLPHAR